jgi:hypothetical protein
MFVKPFTSHITVASLLSNGAKAHRPRIAIWGWNLATSMPLPVHCVVWGKFNFRSLPWISPQ